MRRPVLVVAIVLVAKGSATYAFWGWPLLFLAETAVAGLGGREVW